MITYLKGILTELEKPGGYKILLTLEVNQVAYELQATARQLPLLPALGEPLQLFTHLQVREDQWVLFAFGTRQERDLFRQLISVSGVGPQIALAMLDTLGDQDLVQAVVTGNTRLLAHTPGIGQKTAERLVLELKAKLQNWQTQTGSVPPIDGGPTVPIQEEVMVTLGALGYTQREILKALQAVGRQTTVAKARDPETWVREAIAWLSQSLNA
ncbi:MAG: Holliday junction branch migration protein RuvA [Cyanobacteriota bacterium]|nr:Holliday junction branch migration protein RuvA [Cyanobacteriota bacterium]